MLNRVEAKIMDYLYERCRGKKSVLVTPGEILHSLLPQIELTAKQLDKYIKNLQLDTYIDVHKTDNKGQMMYVVTLKLKGEAFEREKKEIRNRRIRSIGWKVALTFLGIAITYVFWAIFGDG